ncbi:MAG: hypothetical protein ACI924_000553, partial [Flavobacterium sp.]
EFLIQERLILVVILFAFCFFLMVGNVLPL